MPGCLATLDSSRARVLLCLHLVELEIRIFFLSPIISHSSSLSLGDGLVYKLV